MQINTIENSFTDGDTKYIFNNKDKKIVIKFNPEPGEYYFTILEYKIEINPLKFSVITTDKYFEDRKENKEYTIKNSVVLESDLKKDIYFTKEKLEELKKQVLWDSVEDLTGSKLALFSFYNHPEIIPKNDFLKFLQQNRERILVGLIKIENYIKKYNDIELFDTEWGKSIRYKNSADEINKNIINDPRFVKLFDKTSNEYPEISSSELVFSKVRISFLNQMLEIDELAKEQKKETRNKKGKIYKTNWLIFLGFWVSICFFFPILLIIFIPLLIMEISHNLKK
jgi:hypothetical protein